MDGDTTRKTRGKSSQKSERNERQTVGKDDEVEEEYTAMDSLQANISAIYAEIKAIRSDVKTELNIF